MGLFRSSLALRYIPTRWRDVSVTFIPKPARQDYTIPKSFRPISLSSFFIKTLERLCDRYIRDTSLTDRPLHSTQHAYTQGRSTDTALHCGAGYIEESLEARLSTLGVFIDIEGAFDRTTFRSIQAALTERGVLAVLRGWISAMLMQRSTYLKAGDSTLRGRVVGGCPQGGILSPLSWNLTLDSLLCLLNALHSLHIHVC